MKILHVCLASSYNDNWSYHDNLLPRHHKMLGYDVALVTSPFINDLKTEKYLFYKIGTYNDDYGVKIIRIPLIIMAKLIQKLRIYKNTYKYIEDEKPDIIFVHGGQFFDLRKVIKYVKKNPKVKLYIDNHADFSNSARTWFSYHIIHKILWKSGMRKSISYVRKFYGVLPARVDFLIKMYGIPQNKVELLVMGADDELVKHAEKQSVQLSKKEQYKIKEEDFLIVTGGKIDHAKQQIILLLKAVKQMKKSVKLIMFGSIIEDMKQEVLDFVDGQQIQYLGWLNSKESYEVFGIADLAVFPGRHSVYWEQACGQGVPIIVKYWEGTTHIDLGGNCRFLYNDDIKEIKQTIQEVINNQELYDNMKKIAVKEGIKKFSYLNLAKESIEIEKEERK